MKSLVYYHNTVVSLDTGVRRALRCSSEYVSLLLFYCSSWLGDGSADASHASTPSSQWPVSIDFVAGVVAASVATSNSRAFRSVDERQVSGTGGPSGSQNGGRVLVKSTPGRCRWNT